jgi:dTDP-4-amino-4,6-dideoxygalactose transaminase
MKRDRRKIKEYYDELLSDISGVKTIKVKNGCDPMWHLYPIFVRERSKVFKYLREKGVGVQVNYVPAYQHPVFRKHKIDRSLLTTSDEFYNREISLPIYSGLSTEVVRTIVGYVKESLEV